MILVIKIPISIESSVYIQYKTEELGLCEKMDIGITDLDPYKNYKS